MEEHPQLASTWASIDGMLSRLEQMSRSGKSTDIFFNEVVAGLLSLEDVVAAAVWYLSEDEFQLLAQSENFQEPVTGHVLNLSGQREQLQTVLEKESSLVLDDEPVRILAPFVMENGAGVLLDVFLTEGIPSSMLPPLREILEAVVDVAGHYFVRQRYRNLHDELTIWNNVETAIHKIYEGDSFRDCNNNVAEAIQSTTGADRISIFDVTRFGCKMVAASGTGTIHRRSPHVKLLERLGKQVVKSGVPLTFVSGDESNQHLPAKLNKQLQAYLLETHCRHLRMEFVHEQAETTSRCRSLIVLEHFNGNLAETEAIPKLEKLLPHATIATRNTFKQYHSGWRRITSTLASMSLLFKLAGLLLIVAAAVCLLMFIQTDFEIIAEGQLLPTQRHAIYAPTDGIVLNVPVSHGEGVLQGNTLIELKDPDLELEQKRLLGEIATLESQIESARIARTKDRFNRKKNTTTPKVSPGTEKVLEKQLEGAKTELSLIIEQQKRLTISSPITGEVSCWNLDQSLRSRPVVHGQYLMDVVNPKGEWELQLQLPDDDIGYVVAYQKDKEDCKVEFLLRTDPTNHYPATLSKLSHTTQLNEAGLPAVRALVSLGKSPVPHPRTGASVIARIHCGRRSLGFVWFREILEYTKRHFWF